MFGRKLIKGIVLTVNVVVVLFLLLSLLSAVVSPDKFVYLAYFSLFFPVIACINILFVIFWIIVRRWLFLVSFVALIFVYQPLSQNFALNFKKKNVENTERSFSILTYNTRMMYWMVKERGNPIISHILTTDADIVCLQEFSTSLKKEFLSEKDILKMLNRYPYYHIEYNVKNYHSMNSGNAVFSKYPIIKRERIMYDTRGNLSMFSDIVIAEKDTIRLINNHLESNVINDKERQKISDLQSNFDTDNLKSTTKYLSGQLTAAYRVRARQADKIAQVVSKSPYKTVVCGDFNDVPGSYAYSKIKGDKLKDAFTEKGFGLGWTYNSSLFKVRIDYVLYPEDFTLSKYEVKKVKYSDHYPVYCRINY